MFVQISPDCYLTRSIKGVLTLSCLVASKTILSLITSQLQQLYANHTGSLVILGYAVHPSI